MAHFTRRNLIVNTMGILLFNTFPFVFANERLIKIIAVRTWPSSTYTRLTLETDLKLKYKYFYLNDPVRLVIDLENIQFNDIIQNLPNKIANNDQFIEKVIIHKLNDINLRIVFILKTAVNPQIFTLDPIANYQNRFVVDFYPVNVSKSDDPLMSLLEDYNLGKISIEKFSNNSQNDTVMIVTDQDELDKKIQEILNKQDIKHNDGKKLSTISNNIKRKRKVVVIIDPGHGGEDSGAIGHSGLQEKNVVLNISRLLKKKLTSKGYKVYMTRNEDIFIPLMVRVAKSRKLQGDVFVSIHADAFTNPNARGSGVFALSYKGATSSAAKYLADTQNSSDLIGGVKKVGNYSIDNTLFDLTQTATINYSLKLGQMMLSELNKINKLHKNYVDQAAFAVLKAPDIPSILIETAFISNPAEEQLLSNNNFREKVATAISNGLISYINKYI